MTHIVAMTPAAAMTHVTAISHVAATDHAKEVILNIATAHADVQNPITVVIPTLITSPIIRANGTDRAMAKNLDLGRNRTTPSQCIPCAIALLAIRDAETALSMRPHHLQHAGGTGQPQLAEADEPLYSPDSESGHSRDTGVSAPVSNQSINKNHLLPIAKKFPRASYHHPHNLATSWVKMMLLLKTRLWKTHLLPVQSPSPLQHQLSGKDPQ